MTERSLEELKQRVRVCLRGVSQDLRDECIRLAADKSPSAAFDAAEVLARMRGERNRQIAKGTRWLAVIRREHGDKAFQGVVAQLAGKPVTQSWRLASGEEVIDREGETHIHGNVEKFFPEMFARVYAQGETFIPVEHNFHRSVGMTNCVRTRPDDAIVYAQRVGRFGHTRFVKNRQPEPSSVVTVFLRLRSDGRYEIMTAYIGSMAPREPYEPKARRGESLTFWLEHALIWGSEPIIEGTETDQCPW